MATPFTNKMKNAGLVPLAMFICLNGLSQSVSVSGPTCVVPSTIYLYNITGNWVSGSTVQVCVTGGMLVDSGKMCAGGSGVISFVRVSWDSAGQTSGNIAVTTSLGNASLQVSITSALTAGDLDSAISNQSVDSVTTPATLTCSAPTGGNCQPSFNYQWQQSPDNVIWQNIGGATAAQLAFSGPLAQTGYYRRIVTDTSSGSIAYSNVATIFVNTPTPAQ